MQSESTLKSVATHNSNKTKHKSQKPTIMHSKTTLKSAKNIKSTIKRDKEYSLL
jgi:hypothetical protein